MPDKLKLKCPSCGTWFKAANYKRTLCPGCFDKAAKARSMMRMQEAAKVAAKAASSPPTSGAGTGTTPAPGQPLLVFTLEAGKADQKGAGRADSQVPPSIVAPETAHGTKAPKERQSTPPFTPTFEHIAAIERRYAELAQPAEFDGIRARIADELGIPKSVVKRVVQEYRQRLHLPSWWDLSHQQLTDEQVEQVRQRYEPLLPLPPVGVHRIIAEELNCSAWAVYDAIGQMRTRLGLARFNERDDAPLPDRSTPVAGVASGDHVA